MISAQWITNTRSSAWLLTIAVGLANFNDLFLFSIIVPVIPFAMKQRTLVKNDDEAQRWVSILLAVYGVAWFFFSPICGYISDHAAHIRHGRRACILVGLVIFVVATALLCIGTSISVLVAGRILQGAASAMNQTLPRAMLVQRAGTKKAGIYMGYLSFVGCVANISSFLLSGLIYERVGYRPIWILCFAMVGTEATIWLAILEPCVQDGVEPVDTIIKIDLGHEQDIAVIAPATPQKLLTPEVSC